MALNNLTSIVPDSNVVILKPTLNEDQRKVHMQFVKDVCQNQRVPNSSQPARVTRVVRYPLNSESPEFFTYFGNFNPEIEMKIKERTNEVETIRLEQLGQLDTNGLGTIERPTANWGLAAMSNTRETFEKQWIAYKKKTTDVARRQEDTFKYNGIGKLGDGTTIYILDSGYHPQAIGAAGLTRNRHRFFDMGTIDPNVYEDLANTGRLRKEHKELEQAQQFRDIDQTKFHGTNVAVLAGLAAPEAKIVSVMVTDLIDDVVCPREGHMLDALAMIDMMIEKSKSNGPCIINCSWRMGKQKLPLIDQVFQKLFSKGACIVTSAGNEGLDLSKQGQIDSTTGKVNPLTATSKQLPDDFNDTIIFGSLEVHKLKDEKTKSEQTVLWRADHTNRPNDKEPLPNLFLFAPGHHLPAWSPDNINPPRRFPEDHGNLPLASGTSYAAPLASGTIACLLSGQNKKLTRNELGKVIKDNVCDVSWGTDIPMLRWEPPKPK